MRAVVSCLNVIYSFAKEMCLYHYISSVCQLLCSILSLNFHSAVYAAFHFYVFWLKIEAATVLRKSFLIDSLEKCSDPGIEPERSWWTVSTLTITLHNLTWNHIKNCSSAPLIFVNRVFIIYVYNSIYIVKKLMDFFSKKKFKTKKVIDLRNLFYGLFSWYIKTVLYVLHNKLNSYNSYLNKNIV